MSEPRTIHVAPIGTATGDGSAESPLGTIQTAAERAQAGDTVRIHAGIYRERIDPPRGGSSDEQRITFEAAGDGEVIIKGSEPVAGWEHLRGDLWRTRIDNAVFGEFNPFATQISGHWFNRNGRNHHRGSVFLNGHWLREAAEEEDLEEVDPDALLWFGEAEATQTTLLAQFPGINPNDHVTEISVRESVFYPSRPGVHYLTVRGLTLLHAATPWAPPTTEQIGLLGTNWGKGWIIEENTVAYSACAGITLGKYDDPEDFGNRDVVEFTDGEDTYHGTIRRALEHGWTLDSTGHHIVRHNEVSHCEMAGICGSLGAVCSRIEDNVVHDIHVHQHFKGFEQAGIKFHAPIDTLIKGNSIYRCNRGLWMDWMSQGTRITQNLCYDNGPDPDLFLEVNHGPSVVDNNLFLSDLSLSNWSESTLLAHNLFLGRIIRQQVLDRTTPYHQAHSTALGGYCTIPGGDDRVIGNIVAGPGGLDAYETVEQGAPSLLRDNLVSHEVFVEVVEVEDDVRVDLEMPEHVPDLEIVDGEKLERATVSGAAFEDWDGSPLTIDIDFDGDKRGGETPAGPWA